MNKLKLLYTLTIFFILISCKKEELQPQIKNTMPNSQSNDDMIILGNQLKDPYEIENMQKAYTSIKKSREVQDIEITPTHKYIRFLPKDEIEWALLKSDTILNMYDYPLHFEVINSGSYYHDPTLPDSSITWQYCVMPIDHTIPKVQHEKIYDVFLPEYTEDFQQKLNDNTVDFYNELEFESVKLTGNLTKDGDWTKKSSKWTPKGKIRVYDDYLGWIPLVGAKVNARWFTRTESTLTDDFGNFSMPQFKFEVNYSIKWERKDFDIREGEWGQVWFNGPKKKGDWNLDISDGKSLRYATIHRAAHHYYYGNIGGLKRPPLDKWYKRALKIGYYHKKASGDFNGDANPYWPQWYTWPDLRIFGENSNGWRNTLDVYATTIHEIAHASHWDLSGKIIFISTKTIVVESWARGVQWYLTRMIYSGYQPPYNFGDYTGVVEDLIDGISSITSYDQVSGYTMNQIEQALYGAKNWNDWKYNIKHNYENVTENQLDSLFNYWD